MSLVIIQVQNKRIPLNSGQHIMFGSEISYQFGKSFSLAEKMWIFLKLKSIISVIILNAGGTKTYCKWCIIVISSFIDSMWYEQSPLISLASGQDITQYAILEQHRSIPSQSGVMPTI